MPGKRSYRKDKIRKHRSKLLHRTNQSGGSPPVITDNNGGNNGGPAEVKAPPVVNSVPNNAPLNPPTSNGAPVNTVPQNPSVVNGQNPVNTAPQNPSVVNGQNPVINTPSNAPNSAPMVSETDPNNAQNNTQPVALSIEEIYQKLYDYTKDMNGKQTLPINVNPFAEYTGTISYTSQQAPQFDGASQLYNNILARPPYYSLHSYQIMNIYIDSMPQHQQDFLKNALVDALKISEGEARAKMTELKNVWVVYYHPKFQGLVFSKHVTDEKRLETIRIDNAERFFGNSFIYTQGAHLMYGVYNSRVKVIKFEHLPVYQQDWLERYTKMQIDLAKNGDVNALMGCFKDESSGNSSPWFNYHQNSVTGTPYGTSDLPQMNSNSENNVNKVPEQNPINHNENKLEADFNSMNKTGGGPLSGKEIMLLDWHPRQVAVMPLSPAQVLYHFDCIGAIRRKIQEKEADRAVQNNNEERTATGVNQNADQIVRQLAKVSGHNLNNVGNASAPSPSAMPPAENPIQNQPQPAQNSFQNQHQPSQNQPNNGNVNAN